MRSGRLWRLAGAFGLVATCGVALGACGASAATSSLQGCQASGATTIAAPAPTAGARSLAPGAYDVTLTVQTFHRCFLLYVPKNPAVANRPLVLVYHGALDTAASTESSTDFEQVAGKTGQVLAFMQGYADTWNDGAGATPAQKAHVNDVQYTVSSIAAIEKLTTFDHARIVAAGFSNGALLAEYLGCRLANELRLVVPVEGELPVSISKTCAPSRPISVYEIHGTADNAIPYDGGTFTGVDGAVVTVLSAPKSAARWAALDACSASPLVTHPSSSIALATFGLCKRDRLVVLRTIYGGGHAWGQNVGQLVANAIPPAS